MDFGTLGTTITNAAIKATDATAKVGRERLTPAAVIASGVLVGLAVAVLVRSFLVPITNALISVVQGITAGLDFLLPDILAEKLAALEDIREPAAGFDYGVGAFGAVFLLTKVQDIVATVSELLDKWKTAEPGLLVRSFVSLTIGFGALGLSVYGLEKLADPERNPTFVFDALTVPPSRVDATTGHMTFYISFLDEGGPPTFGKGHRSVTVADRDQVFLGKLREAFEVCGSSTKPVRVRLEGFASGSLWTTADYSLQEMSQGFMSVANRPIACDPASIDPREAPRRALACISEYKANERALREVGYLSSDPVETGKAFNVYLANRRREAVARILGSSEHLKVESSDWPDHFHMQQAIAVDDTRADGTFGVKGILTRSVAVTITDPSSCSRADVERWTQTALVLK